MVEVVAEGGVAVYQVDGLCRHPFTPGCADACQGRIFHRVQLLELGVDFLEWSHLWEAQR